MLRKDKLACATILVPGICAETSVQAIGRLLRTKKEALISCLIIFEGIEHLQPEELVVFD